MKRWLARHGPIALALGAYLILIVGTGIGCPIRFVTGIACPFCGITRAWFAALRLDFSAAFFFHPLFLLGPPLIFLAVHRQAPFLRALPRRASTAVLIGGGALFAAVWALRLALFPIP